MPISALPISMISLVIGIHHSRTMQEMAQADSRLLTASPQPTQQCAITNDSFTFLDPPKPNRPREAVKHASCHSTAMPAC
jgi:hypothetical protein